MKSLHALAVAVAIALGSAPAAAESPRPSPPPGGAWKGESARAQELWKSGMAHYNVGSFDAAIRDFKEAYEISAAPGLLFNLAQASRLAGQPEQAVYFYRTYLRLMPYAPNREDAEARIVELSAQLKSEREAARVAPPPAATPAAQAIVAPPLRVLRTPPPGKPLLWAGLGVGLSGVALLASGIGLGVAADDHARELTDLGKKGGQWASRYQSVYEQGRSEALAASVLYGIGGAAAGIGAVLAVVGWRRDVALKRFGVAPVPGGAVAVSSWRF